MTHLTTEQLLEIAEDPNRLTDDQRTHLLSCAECRTKLSNLQRTMDQFNHEAGQLKGIASGVSETTLSDYFDGSLDETQASAIKAEIQSHGALTKEALHFLTHSAAMDRSLNNTAVVQEAEQPEVSLKERVTDWLQSWRAPVWQTASASFAVALVVGVLFLNSPSSDAPTNVVQFQNDSGLYWQLPQPGMGFFQLSTAEQEPFDGVLVEMIGDQVQFQWPEIQGVSEYQLQVQTLQQGNVMTVLNTTIDQTEVLESLTRFETGRQYDWTLTGLAEDGRQFRAQGGFVMMGQ